MQVGKEGQIDHGLGVSHGSGLAGSGQFLLLEGSFQFPSGDALPSCCQGFLPEPRDQLESLVYPNRKSEVKIESAEVLSQSLLWWPTNYPTRTVLYLRVHCFPKSVC